MEMAREKGHEAGGAGRHVIDGIKGLDAYCHRDDSSYAEGGRGGVGGVTLLSCPVLSCPGLAVRSWSVPAYGTYGIWSGV